MTDKQLKMQEAILLAVHPWCTIKQAVEKETSILWCLAIDDGILWHYCWKWFWRWTGEKWYFNAWFFDKIIGLPPTLERTLVALGDGYWYDWGICYMDEYADWDEYQREIPRKLLNDNWTPCDLFSQSEETQDTIYSILCKDE